VEVPMSLLTGLVMFVLVLAVLLSKGRPAAFLALPGHFEIGWQLEAALTVWTSDGRDQGGQQPSENGLPHGGQAR